MTKMKMKRRVSFLVQLFTETLPNYLYFDDQLNISQLVGQFTGHITLNYCFHKILLVAYYSEQLFH